MLSGGLPGLSRRNSEPEADSKDSLSKEAQSRFFAEDHVGVVRHFEGVDLDLFVRTVRGVLASEGVKFRESKERVDDILVYTNVGELDSNRALTFWITITEVRGVGSVLDAKVIHPTDYSAEADERLAAFVDKLSKTLPSP